MFITSQSHAMFAVFKCGSKKVNKKLKRKIQLRSVSNLVHANNKIDQSRGKKHKKMSTEKFEANIVYSMVECIVNGGDI